MIPILADDLPPPFTVHQLTATGIEWQPMVMMLVATALYLWGAWRVGRRVPGPGWSWRRTVAFLGGMVVVFVAVESVIGVYDGALFWDHMIQHLLLIMVASALFAMGAPVELLRRASGGRLHRLTERALASRVAEVVGHPITGFLLYVILIPLAHLTSFYNLTLEHEAVHNAEHMAFLVVGYLFWRPVVAIEPSRHPLNPGLRLLYLALAVPVDTFSGLALVSAAHEMFPAYTQMHRTWGPSLVSDLHIGGAIMWVGGDTLMLAAMIPVAVQWMRAEEARAAEVDRTLAQEQAGPERASPERASPERASQERAGPDPPASVTPAAPGSPPLGGAGSGP
jgi:putative copper resistance protein D